MILLELLRADGSITVNKALVHAIGLNEAILFCELVSRKHYFESRGLLDENNYFFNTQYDLQAGTGIGEKAQRTAISNLKKFNLIECEVRGIPAKRYFKICATDKILETLIKIGKEKAKALANPTDTSLGGNLKLRRKEQEVAKRSANNTNNNTNSNNTKKNIMDFSKEKPLSFFNYCNGRKVGEEIIEGVYHYLQSYAEHMGADHPWLKPEQWDRVVERLFNVEIEHSGSDVDIDIDGLDRMIEQHFKTKYKNCDYNILHFVENGIKYRRYCEVGM